MDLPRNNMTTQQKHGCPRTTPRFDILLSASPLQPDDDESKWRFEVTLPPLPPSEFDPITGYKIWIKHITVKTTGIRLSYDKQSTNRVHGADPAEKFILATFSGLQFKDEPPKVTRSYIERFLLSGITINRVTYFFYGHSNSQLKSSSCYLYATSSPSKCMAKINELGSFSNISSVAKRAKRIGLLFTAAESSVKLDVKLTRDIADVEENGYTFTDGCGMINKDFAHQLAMNRRILYHDQKYCPSVFQIRYKGYKGVVMLNPALPKDEKVHFRSSMMKFKGCSDDTFAVLNYSKPFTFAYLNGEIVTLLSALKIRNETLLQKQNEYFDFLQQVCLGTNLGHVFKFLCYQGQHGLAEKVLLEGFTPQILKTIRKLVKVEWSGMFKDKNGEKVERVRVLIPKSRMLFGVCDYTATLKEGECFVRITNETSGAQTVDGAEIIVSRNPCLHPGDIRKFKAVSNPALNHLVDCIVFPIVGKRDPASLMSGGDLDGDTFFVCWDKDLIPQIVFEPYGYPPAREAFQRTINWESMVTYFAHWNNASLGRVKNLYLKWAQAKNNAGCTECQELNKFFSSCVDGESVKIPEHLNTPTPNPEDNADWVLNVLIENIRNRTTFFQQEGVASSFQVTPTQEQMIEILTSKELCLRDEFELFQIALRYCSQSRQDIDDYIAYFDFGSFTTPQKNSVLSSLMQCHLLREQYIGPIFNALYYSNLLTLNQLKQANLDGAMVRWQIYYASEGDDGHRIYTSLENAFLHFDKKLVVAKVDENLTIAMYIPARIEINQELNVGGYRESGNTARHAVFPTVKLFAWDPTSGHFYQKTTVRGYKIKFDGEIFQLFEKQIRNTFVWFALNQKYQVRNGMRTNTKYNMGASRFKSQQEDQTGHYKFSIALNKFDQNLSRSHARVTKQLNSKLEIYVISNRDRVGHELLDIYMNQVDTKEIKAILENIPKEYDLPMLERECVKQEDIDWTYREWCREILLPAGASNLHHLENFCELEQVLMICTQVKSMETKLIQIFNSILQNPTKTGILFFSENLALVEECLKAVPSLTFDAINALDIFQLSTERNKNVVLILLKYIVRLANSEPETCKQFLSKLFDWVALKEIKFTLPVLVDLVKLILFSVRITPIAEDFLSVIFSPKQQFTFALKTNSEEGEDTNNIMNPTELNYALHNIQALAMEYLGELSDSVGKCDSWGVPIGAEEFGISKPVLNDFQSKLDREGPMLSDFFSDMHIKSEASKPTNSIPALSIVSPLQINLEIKRSEKSGRVYTTILRTDIHCTIKCEDHVRFCASKKASNAPKRGRLPVFNAIVKSISMGKMEFVIVQEEELNELFLASWNIYAAASTTNFSNQLSAVMTLLTEKGDATAGYFDILEMSPPDGEKFWREKLVPHAEVSFDEGVSLNPSQEKAVIEAVTGSTVTAIWGPPGTGKTSVVVEILIQLLKTYSDRRLLVTASTHAAVDNILDRFIVRRKEQFPESGDSEDVIRLTSDLSKVKPSLKRWTLDAFVGKDLHAGDDKAKGKAMKKWKEGRLVFCTCSGAGVGVLRDRNNNCHTALSIKGLHDEDEYEPINEPNPSSTKIKNRKLLQKLQKFDVVIVDEASQITEPNALIPIVKSSNIVILVGDHVQLAPTVSEKGKELFNLDKSLFEKLYTSSTTTNCVRVMLDTQYRMHPQLAIYPSITFYDGKYKSGVTLESRCMQISAFPWPQGSRKNENASQFPSVFIHCPTRESYGGSSKVNTGQVAATRDIITLLRNDLNQQLLVKPLGITVLTPYAKQKMEIAKALKNLGASGSGVEVHTIDGFQGRENDIIIFSTVRSNQHKDLGFMKDRRRINVALTRAKFGIVILGDEETLLSNLETAKMISEPFCKKVDISPLLRNINSATKQKK